MKPSLCLSKCEPPSALHVLCALSSLTAPGAPIQVMCSASVCSSGLIRLVVLGYLQLYCYNLPSRLRCPVPRGGQAFMTDTQPASTSTHLQDAVGEAGFMTGLEQNADVVRMAAFAPLLTNIQHPQKNWAPNTLISFDGSRCCLQQPNHCHRAHGHAPHFFSGITAHHGQAAMAQVMATLRI